MFKNVRDKSEQSDRETLIVISTNALNRCCQISINLHITITVRFQQNIIVRVGGRMKTWEL